MIKANYHTHTIRCGHAVGSDEDYVLAAIEAGLDTLGFSDHMPYPDASNPGDRMEFDQRDEYINSINSLKEKYKNQIKIYTGFETEFYPERMDLYKEMSAKVDYMICGQHYKDLDKYAYDVVCTDEDMLSYADQVVQAIESGLFKFIAHPSYFMLGRDTWTKACDDAAHRICQAAEKFNCPLEINLKGTKHGKALYNGIETYKYPNLNFWKIASQYKVKAIIGFDAHDPKYLKKADFFKTMEKDFQDLGIEIIEKLEM